MEIKVVAVFGFHLGFSCFLHPRGEKSGMQSVPERGRFATKGDVRKLPRHVSEAR
jgi:hypothetical protein